MQVFLAGFESEVLPKSNLTRVYKKRGYFLTTTAPPLHYKYEVLHTIHSVLNTSVKVSSGAHHYLPRKTFLKLC